MFSLRSRESIRRARTGGDVLTKERLKEKEPERRRRRRRRRQRRRRGGTEERGELGETEERREWSGEGRGEERRCETPASVEGSLASEAGVARTRRREGKRKDRERGGGVGGRELENERATLLRESRKVASPAAYAVRSFLFFLFLLFFPRRRDRGTPLERFLASY